MAKSIRPAVRPPRRMRCDPPWAISTDNKPYPLKSHSVSSQLPVLNLRPRSWTSFASTSWIRSTVMRARSSESNPVIGGLSLSSGAGASPCGGSANARQFRKPSNTSDESSSRQTCTGALHYLGPPNAPVQARWANAQRAGPTPPNPPTVACNRWLGV